jgi:methylmalonyl-CoA mutase N-terminal domain/subunit
MTINAPAPKLFAMYIVLAERGRIDWRRFRDVGRTTS